MKKTIISILVLVILILLAVSFFLSQASKKEVPSSAPITTPTPILVPVSTATPMPLDKQLINQTEADKNFSAWQKDIQTNYPWYNNLPLQEDGYFVYFDLDQKTFFAYLYPKSSKSE